VVNSHLTEELLVVPLKVFHIVYAGYHLTRAKLLGKDGGSNVGVFVMGNRNKEIGVLLDCLLEYVYGCG